MPSPKTQSKQIFNNIIKTSNSLYPEDKPPQYQKPNIDLSKPVLD